MNPYQLATNPWLTSLGYAGLLPFIGGALFLWWPQLQALVPEGADQYVTWGLFSYSALIFSFLSGLLWFGSFVVGQHSQRQASQMLWVSISAMLWSWSGFAWLWVSPSLTLLGAGLSYLLLWVYEREVLAHWYPAGFFQLRTRLTWVAALSLWSAGLALEWGAL